MNEAQTISEALRSQTIIAGISHAELAREINKADQALRTSMVEVSTEVMRQGHKTATEIVAPVSHAVRKLDAKVDDVATRADELKQELAELKSVMPVESYSKLSALVAKALADSDQLVLTSISLIERSLELDLSGKPQVISGSGVLAEVI